MAIERSIYASLRVGMKGSPGFQYYSYTNGYKDLILDKNSDIENQFTTFYRAPNGVDTWYLDKETGRRKTPKTNEEANTDEAQIRKHHPVTFAYKKMKIGALEKCVFLYGKNNGGDFSNNRYNTPYHCSVICDCSDINRQPVLYCDSSIVCCDIPRSAILTEPDSNEKPSILTSPVSLDSESDTLDIVHFAGFMDITFSDICNFLRGENRMNCFKSMVSSLMKLKEGNEKCRIVIADKKENIITWIAAISYLYSVENSLDISFCTYGYKISDYDINGVYRADINNEPIDKSWPGEITEYELSKVSDDYAVYDFAEKYYAPEVQVENDSFMMMLDRTFLNEDEKRLSGYKSYIETKTSFRGLDSRYKRGYKLYLFNELNKELDANDFKEAIDFAKVYASENEKRKTANIILDDLPKNDVEINKIYTNYINYVTANNIISLQEVNRRIIDMIAESILNLHNEKNKYDSLKVIADKVCKFSEGSMLAALTKKIGIGEMKNLVDKSDDWRMLVLMEAVCDSAQKNQIDLEVGNTAYNIICLALYNTVDTTEKGKKIAEYMSNKPESVKFSFFYKQEYNYKQVFLKTPISSDNIFLYVAKFIVHIAFKPKKEVTK